MSPTAPHVLFCSLSAVGVDFSLLAAAAAAAKSCSVPGFAAVGCRSRLFLVQPQNMIPC